MPEVSGLNPGKGKRFFSSLRRPDRLRGNLVSHPVVMSVSVPGVKDLLIKLTAHLHPEQKSRIRELYLSSPYAFMAWYFIKGTTLPFLSFQAFYI
jgi:hypothetical protein